MKRLILPVVFLSLISCSTTNNDGMRLINKGPRGLSIINITKQDRVKAYRAAEKHCAKYYKVTRKLNSEEQEQVEEFQIAMRTTNFECLKPSN